MTEPICRPDTWDRAIYECVALRNEYGLPDEIDGVVVDIGAHIGSFSAAALERGASRAYAYEANRANAALATYNLARFGSRASVVRAAVWRSDRTDSLQWCGSSNPVNTGGGGVVFCEDGEPTPTVALDDILRLAGRVKILKLDCEGAEWPILMTSRELARVEEIAGEWHEIGGEYNDAEAPERAMVDGRTQYTEDVLVHFLQLQGFDVMTQRSCDAHGLPVNLGHFRAMRSEDETAPYAA